jgi:DNA damage-binding protein 1
MQPIFTFDLDRFEQGLSCTTVVFEPGSAEYFVVGSAYVVPDEQEPTRGRILVFEVVAAADEGSEEKRLHLLTEKEEKGAVFTLAPLCGKLVAGIGSKVRTHVL